MALIYANGFDTLPNIPNLPPSITSVPASGVSTGMGVLRALGFITIPVLYSAIVGEPIVSQNTRYGNGQYLSGKAIRGYGASANVNPLHYFSLTYPIGHTVGTAARNSGGITMGFAGRISSGGSHQTVSASQGLSFGFDVELNGASMPNMICVQISSAQIYLIAGNYFFSPSKTVTVNVSEPHIAAVFNPNDYTSWHYYELVWEPDSAPDTYRVILYIDGVEITRLSALTLVGDAYLNRLVYAGFSGQDPTTTTNNSKWFDIDDFYISDRTGTTNTERIRREMIITRIAPSVDNTTQWSKSGGTIGTNASRVSDVKPYVKTDSFVSTNTIGAQDLYQGTISYPKPVRNIAGLVLETVGVQTSITPNTAKSVLTLSNGTSSVDSSPISLTHTPVYGKTVFDKNPFTNQPFTTSELTSYAFGIKKTE